MSRHIIIVFSLLLVLTTSINFAIDINYYERWCFKEFIGKYFYIQVSPLLTISKFSPMRVGSTSSPTCLKMGQYYTRTQTKPIKQKESIVMLQHQENINFVYKIWAANKLSISLIWRALSFRMWNTFLQKMIASRLIELSTTLTKYSKKSSKENTIAWP